MCKQRARLKKNFIFIDLNLYDIKNIIIKLIFAGQLVHKHINKMVNARVLVKCITHSITQNNNNNNNGVNKASTK